MAVRMAALPTWARMGKVERQQGGSRAAAASASQPDGRGGGELAQRTVDSPGLLGHLGESG